MRVHPTGAAYPDELWINLDQIVWLSRVGEGASLRCSGGVTLVVTESPEEIIALLRKLK